MRAMFESTVRAFGALIALGFFSTSAHAYLDPGTGSLILQAVLGTIAAASVAIGAFWNRIRVFLERFRRGGKPESPAAGESEHGGD